MKKKGNDMTQKEFNHLVKNATLTDEKLLEAVQTKSTIELVEILKQNQK